MKAISKSKILILATIVLCIGFAILYSYMRCQKAVSIAEDYLSEKYEKKMKNTGVRYSWIDPCLYHVHFSPEDDPECTFRVLVQNDLSISGPTSEFGEETGSADNYYTGYFERELEKTLQKETDILLGNIADINVLYSSSPMYSFYIPDGLNDNMSLEDMLEIIDGHYYIYVKFPDKIIFDIDSEELPLKGFSFLQTIKAKYDPLNVIFRFRIDGEKEMVSAGFDNWKEIDTMDEFSDNLKQKVDVWRRVR